MRAHEQLQILLLLLEDPDPQIRTVANETLNRIPEAPLRAVPRALRRADEHPGVLRQSGVFPAETPASEADEPLIDTEPTPEIETGGKGESDEQRRVSINQQLAVMSFTDRLKAASKGSREMRSILIRDPNKLISSSVLSSPKVTDQEIENFSRMANVSEDVLRIIGSNRAWTKNYGVAVGLTKNPKTPVLTLSLHT